MGHCIGVLHGWLFLFLVGVLLGGEHSDRWVESRVSNGEGRELQAGGLGSITQGFGRKRGHMIPLDSLDRKISGRERGLLPCSSCSRLYLRDFISPHRRASQYTA